MNKVDYPKMTIKTLIEIESREVGILILIHHPSDSIPKKSKNLIYISTSYPLPLTSLIILCGAHFTMKPYVFNILRILRKQTGLKYVPQKSQEIQDSEYFTVIPHGKINNNKLI